MNDLYINGTSVASGFGLGKEVHFGKRDMSITTAWPHMFANKHNVGEMWNHSLPSKPIELSIRDTKGFVEQYLASGRHATDLFCAIEFLLPYHPLFQPLIQTDSKVIFPVIYQNDPLQTPDFTTAGTFGSHFVECDKHPDYLTGGAIYTPAGDTIDTKLITMHEHERHSWIAGRSASSIMRRLDYVATAIADLQVWLKNRGVNAIMFWACGGSELVDNTKYSKLVDKALTARLPYKKNYIPMSDFSCLNYGIAQSLTKSMHRHPDQVGHHRIAEYLDNYLISNSIL